MAFVAEQWKAEPSLSFAQLAEAVKQKFNLRVHPRSIERQLLREKTPVNIASSYTPAPPDQDGLVASYEELRARFLSGQRGSGLAVFIGRGMWEWMNGCLLCAPAPTKVLAVANDEAVLPRDVRTEVVLIVAGMVLHKSQDSRS